MVLRTATTAAAPLINTPSSPPTLCPGIDPNSVLEIDYTSAGWGAGTGHDLGGQDWSPYNGFGFWMLGSNSGRTYRVILSDNPNPDVPGDSAERFAYEFADNSIGWRLCQYPLGSFFRDPAFQPPGAPDDGLTLTDVQAYALALPAGTRVTYLDHVALFGDGESVATSVAFASSAITPSRKVARQPSRSSSAPPPMRRSRSTSPLADGTAADGDAL